MNAVRPQRWLMSFADLTLLLLAFFVLLHARDDGRAAAASVRTAFGGRAAATSLEVTAVGLFQPGEAVLAEGAAERLRALAARLAGRRVHIVGRGGDATGHRLDAWELTAARLAVLARGLEAGGLDPAAIELELPSSSAARAGPQRFELVSA